MIQILCATVPGKVSPLLQPEAALFPRHFYITAANDTCSILGARPLFLMNEKPNPYGFCSVYLKLGYIYVKSIFYYKHW